MKYAVEYRLNWGKARCKKLNFIFGTGTPLYLDAKVVIVIATYLPTYSF